MSVVEKIIPLDDAIEAYQEAKLDWERAEAQARMARSEADRSASRLWTARKAVERSAAQG